MTRPLTLPVAPRAFSAKKLSSNEEPGPLPPPLRQQRRISRPEAPSLDKCAAHLRRQHPPPISRLCRRDSASGARSPLRCSRTKRLDPRRLRGLFARGREDHAPRVDFCNRYDRRAQPPDRPNPAHRARGRPRAQLQPGCRATAFAASRRPAEPGGRAPFEAQPAETSQVRGRFGRLVPYLLLPPRLLVIEAYPQPDRLGHLSVASALRRRHGDTCAAVTLQRGPPRARPAEPRFRRATAV
jgi:hypothetical protein